MNWKLEKIKKYISKRLLLYTTVILTLFIYFTTVYCSWIYPDRNTTSRIVFLTLFHICFILLVWSFIQTIRTDPGMVPDSTASPFMRVISSTVKICMICYKNKPERTHHCSKCERCILNMDHHCPWLGCCIGMQNRKFFILLVAYALLISFLILLGGTSIVFDILFDSIDLSDQDDPPMNSTDWTLSVLSVIGIMLSFILSIILTIFLEYHIDLIKINKTTIEDYDSKKYADISPMADYNIGLSENIQQVFGEVTWTYPFPFFLSKDGPTVNGISWPKMIKTIENHKENIVTEQKEVNIKRQVPEIKQPIDIKFKQIPQSIPSMQTSHASFEGGLT